MEFRDKYILLKQQKQKITMLTVYDYLTAMILDEGGIDILLVGDSLANVVLGLPTTTQVGMPEMLHHTSAVLRAKKKSDIIVDMPFDAYQLPESKPVLNAKQFMDQGCSAVKVEWFEHCVSVVEKMREHQIEVVGHIGLTPQTAESFKVQGKGDEADKIFQQALALEKAGCSMLVIECVPKTLAEKITQTLTIPTIGIGAGPDCDGQVLVVTDLLGLYDRKIPKFVKQYGNMKQHIAEAIGQYKEEVQTHQFPDDGHCFH